MSPRSKFLRRILAAAALAAPAVAAPPVLTSAQAVLFCDDAPGSENVQFAAAAYSVTEDQGSVDLAVHHLPCVGSGADPAVVNWTVTGGTATEEDYDAAAGTLTFPAGDFNDRAISLVINDDTTAEPAETVIVTLSPGNEATGIVDPGTATVTIGANDQLPDGNTSPRITQLRPVTGTVVRDRTPLIAATVRDRQTNLSARAIRLFVDGRPRSFAYNRATDRLRHTSRMLARGRHTVRVRVVDPHGALTVRSWTFRVGSQA